MPSTMTLHCRNTISGDRHWKPPMPRKPDPNEEAARIVRMTTGQADELPADLEAAWLAWSSCIHSCDERTRTLLRAAFEAVAQAAAHRLPARQGPDFKVNHDPN